MQNQRGRVRTRSRADVSVLNSAQTVLIHRHPAFVLSPFVLKIPVYRWGHCALPPQPFIFSELYSAIHFQARPLDSPARGPPPSLGLRALLLSTPRPEGELFAPLRSTGDLSLEDIGGLCGGGELPTATRVLPDSDTLRLPLCWDLRPIDPSPTFFYYIE